MDRQTLFLIVMSAACICVSTMRLTEEQKSQIKQRYCGSVLADMLSMVCQGVYNVYPKKSMSDIINPYDYYEFQDTNDVDDNQIEYPFLSRMNAHSLIPLQFRKRQQKQTTGVADECCHKACTLHELQSYCGIPKKNRRDD